MYVYTYLRDKWRAQELRFNGTCEKPRTLERCPAEQTTKKAQQYAEALRSDSNNFISFDREDSITTCQQTDRRSNSIIGPST